MPARALTVAAMKVETFLYVLSSRSSLRMLRLSTAARQRFSFLNGEGRSSVSESFPPPQSEMK